MNPTKTLITLLICLLPFSVSAEEYVCSMSYEDASKNPYVLSVKREGAQFALKSNNLLGGSGTVSAKQIQEDETLIAMTELHLGGHGGGVPNRQGRSQD